MAARNVVMPGYNTPLVSSDGKIDTTWMTFLRDLHERTGGGAEDLVDSGSGGGAEVNDLSSVVTWANVPDANVTASSVTQHQASISVTESQISDFGSYASTTEFGFDLEI